MRGMSDESYLRAIDGLCYHGENRGFATPPSDIWTGTPPTQRLSRSKHFTVRAGSAARCTSSFPLARAVDQRVRLNHSARRAEVRKRRRSTSALAVTILSHNLTNFLRTV
jgi:hypothetical protein